MSSLHVYNITTLTSSTIKSLPSHQVMRWHRVVAHKIITSTSIQSYCRGYCSRKRFPNSLINVIVYCRLCCIFLILSVSRLFITKIIILHNRNIHTSTQPYAPVNCPSAPYKASAVRLVFILFFYLNLNVRRGKMVHLVIDVTRPLKDIEKKMFKYIQFSTSFSLRPFS